MPRTSCSEPIGISVATTCGPKASLSESSVRKKSARSRSSMFTNTRRARPALVGPLPQPVGRDLDAHHAVDDEHRALADARARRAASATKLGSPGRVDQVELAILVLERRQAGRDRHLPLLLVGLGVGDRGAVGDGPEPVDDPGLEQQGLVQRRLARAPVPDDRDVPDALWRPCEPSAASSPRPTATRDFRSAHDCEASTSACSRALSRSTAFVCSCETRDSVTPSTSPISRRVRFS